MTQIYAAIAIGTAASLTTLTLILLRLNFRGNRPILALARRWTVTSSRASFAVLLPIGAVAAYSLASISAQNWSEHQTSAMVDRAPIASVDGQAWDQLRDYAESIDDGKALDTATAQPSEAIELPAVDVMIAKLIARLKDQPNDVAGWKMLGWTYLNTARPSEAVQAYETALQLAPGDAEIEKSLKAAQSANTEPARASERQTVATATGTSDLAHGEDAMVRGMVERLAARLDGAPHDENGWQQLIRSRVVLGEKGAASAALSKALVAFSSDIAAQQRLLSAARSLGIERTSEP